MDKYWIADGCRYYHTCDNECVVYDTRDHRTLLLVQPLVELFCVIGDFIGHAEFSLNDLSNSLAGQDLLADDESLQTGITALLGLRLLKQR